MIILIGAQKGGCGKTTLTVNLAAELQMLGSKVCLVCADSQPHTSDWAMERLDSPQEMIPHVKLEGNISKQLKDLALNYEVVIADVAGRDSRELRTAMMAADIMVSPFTTSQLDLSTLPMVAGLIEKARDINEDLKCLAVVTRAPTHAKTNEIQETRAHFAEYPEFVLCDTVIHERKAYRDSISYGAGVVEWTDKKAALEIQNLAQEIISHAKA